MERYREVSMDEAFIKSLTSAVKDNLTNDQFGAEELAKEIGISRSQIHRRLKKIQGKSITQFIRELRLEEALRLLQREVGTASEVSYLVGFSSPTYFNTCFREYFGYPPGEVKKRRGYQDAKAIDSTNKKPEVKVFPIQRDVHELPGDEETRRLTTIMFSDISGYTKIMGENEHKAMNLLKKNRELHQSMIDMYHGKLVKEIGDAILAYFDSPSDAVHCAKHIMEVSEDHIDLKLHIGIHLGEVIFKEGDVYGDGVNIASRINGEAIAGEVLISEEVFKNIRNKDNIRFKKSREKYFKNVLDPVMLYKLILNSNGPSVSHFRVFSRKTLVVGIPMLIVVLVLTYYILSFFLPQLAWQIPLGNPLKDKDKSVAVLPFDHEGALEDIYYTDGVMQEIHSNLYMMEGLQVISTTSTENYRDSKLTAKEIAQELGVTYLLEGTVQKQNNHIKIHVRLIYGKTDAVIWAKIYTPDLEIKDFFETQSDIALQIAKVLYVTISPDENERINTIQTNNLTAHDFFLRAREEHTKFTVYRYPNAIDKARKYYHRALDYDSTFARAYAGLGLAYYHKLGAQNLDDQKSPYWDSISTYTEKAIFYNDQLGEAYLLRGIYNYGKNSKIEKALEQIDMALKYDPNNYMAYEEKAFLLWRVLGKYKEAIINTNEAIKRNRGIELANLIGNVGLYYKDMGFYDLAKDYFQEEYKVRDDTMNYLGTFGFLEFSFGNYDMAINWYERIEEIDTSYFIAPTFLIMAHQYEKAYNSSLNYVKRTAGKPWISDIHRIGFSYWQMGHHKQGQYYLNMHIEKCLESIRENSHYAQRKFLYYDLAGTYAFLGEKEKAIQTLEGLKNRHSYPLYMVNMLKKDDPMFDNIRNDSRFQEIVAYVEERYQLEHGQVKEWLIENQLYKESTLEN